MNAFMGTDAVIGKATRKARAWLFSTITGTEIGDGDAGEIDVKATVVGTKIDHESERVALMIKDATTIEDLKKVEPHLKDGQLDLYTVKLDELKAK